MHPAQLPPGGALQQTPPPLAAPTPLSLAPIEPAPARGRSGASSPTRYRTRIRWDNVGILLTALVVCAVGVPLLIQLDTGPKPSRADQKSRSDTTSGEPAGVMSGEASSADVERANELVAEARAELAAGRFDSAEQLIANIDDEASDLSGASELRDEIAQVRSAYLDHARSAHIAVDEGRWPDAAEELDAVAKIAPLTGALQDLRGEVDHNLGALDASRDTRKLIRAGKFDEALARATRGYEEFPTPALRRLIASVRQRQAKARAQQRAAAQAERDATRQPLAPSRGGGSGGRSPSSLPSGSALAGPPPSEPATGGEENPPPVAGGPSADLEPAPAEAPGGMDHGAMGHDMAMAY